MYTPLLRHPPWPWLTAFQSLAICAIMAIRPVDMHITDVLAIGHVFDIHLPSARYPVYPIAGSSATVPVRAHHTNQRTHPCQAAA